MNLQIEIKSQLSTLAQKFHAQTDHDEYDYPWDAELLIFEYCQEKGYKADHIPAEYALFDPDDPDDIFSENIPWHNNELSLMHEDVFELCWFYSHLFWPDIFKTPDDLREIAKGARSEYGL